MKTKVVAKVETSSEEDEEEDENLTAEEKGACYHSSRLVSSLLFCKPSPLI